jgi:hypothetical protein
MTRILGILLGVMLALSATRAPAQDVVHGADSLFISPTVKLAWIVRRGASEADTLVVVRIVPVGVNYRSFRVDGIDPFTKEHKIFVSARPISGEVDVAIPRGQFADHPSTEFRFFASPEDAAANKPKLTVFYLGVPDTTPEFSGDLEARAYLARMLGPK